jgi:uncharacterized protein (DUF305 family)
MKLATPGFSALALLAVGLAGLTSCKSQSESAAGGAIALAPGAGAVGSGSGDAIAAAEKQALAYTDADVDFMTGMIPHHAQAVIMCGWADSHGARADVATLCKRIKISQSDEIRMMRKWLADRGKPVPDSLSTKHMMKMPDGSMHEMLMAGMLTPEQMAALDKARGTEFDYLFLTGMIGHHQGAIDMVSELYTHPGAAEEDTMMRFSQDVVADQSAEIHKMQLMLETVPH